MGHTLAPQAHFLPARAPGGDGELLRAVQGLHLELGAQGGLGHGGAERHPQVVAVPGQGGVGVHPQVQVEVAGRAAPARPRPAR